MGLVWMIFKHLSAILLVKTMLLSNQPKILIEFTANEVLLMSETVNK